MNERPTSVYILWNADREVIYVGITSVRMSRLSQHSLNKDWWQEVAHATFKHFETRSEATLMERRLIRQLDPIYNATLSPRTKAYRREVEAVQKAMDRLDEKLDGMPEPVVILARSAQRTPRRVGTGG